MAAAGTGAAYTWRMRMPSVSLVVMLFGLVAGAQELPGGAESRADELRLRRGAPDIARHLERERLRLESDRLQLESARLRLDVESTERKRREVESRARSVSPADRAWRPGNH